MSACADSKGGDEDIKRSALQGKWQMANGKWQLLVRTRRDDDEWSITVVMSI